MLSTRRCSARGRLDGDVERRASHLAGARDVGVTDLAAPTSTPASCGKVVGTCVLLAVDRAVRADEADTAGALDVADGSPLPHHDLHAVRPVPHHASAGDGVQRLDPRLDLVDGQRQQRGAVRTPRAAAITSSADTWLLPSTVDVLDLGTSGAYRSATPAGAATSRARRPPRPMVGVPTGSRCRHPGVGVHCLLRAVTQQLDDLRARAW